MKLITYILLITISIIPAFSQDLTLLTEDTYIEILEGEDGLHLYVRGKPGIGSIMLTESTEDPEGERSVFTLRDFDVNPTVSNEIRLLNGSQLDKKYNFLIDSTLEENEILGEAFHIYIPKGVSFGYPWSREGQIDIGEGSWINIRTFPLPYGDYEEGFADNPFIVRLKTEPFSEVVEEVVKESIFEEIARETDGNYSEELDGDSAVDQIGKILDKYKGMDVDLALVIDTTVSMKDDVEFIRQKLIPLVERKIDNFKSVRIGIVFYRDYKEAYLTKKFDFVNNFDRIQLILDTVKVSGGRDIPEAVFEAIYEAESNLDWKNDARLIVQIGDAPPHPEPRGEISNEMVYKLAKENDIVIYPILLYDDKRDK